MSPISLFDSTIYQNMFADPDMAAVFDEAAGLKALVDVEKFVAQAQADVGIIPTDAAARIAETLSVDALDLDRLHEDTVEVGRPIAGLVRQLAEQVGPPHDVWVHFGITTYDVMDTARSLQVRTGLDLLDSRLVEVENALAEMAKAHRDTVMIGRTNNLHAQPQTFGAKLAIWIEEIGRHRTRIADIRPRVQLVQFGGAVGTLASLDGKGLAFRTRVAGLSGLNTIQSNWHNARDGIAELGGVLANINASLARNARNLNALSGTDIGEVSESGKKGRGRSTTMPHKRNPRAAEFAEATAHLGRQRAAALVDIVGQDHDRCGGTYICEWMLLPDAFLLTAAALRWSQDLLDRLEVHGDAMRINIDRTRGLALSERYTLALAKHMSKFDARTIIDKAVARAFDENLDLAAVLMDMPNVVACLGAQGIQDLSDPATYVGEAPDIVDRVLAARSKDTTPDA